MKPLDNRQVPDVTGGAQAAPYPVTDCPPPYGPGTPTEEPVDPMLQPIPDGLTKSIK